MHLFIHRLSDDWSHLQLPSLCSFSLFGNLFGGALTSVLVWRTLICIHDVLFFDCLGLFGESSLRFPIAAWSRSEKIVYKVCALLEIRNCLNKTVTENEITISPASMAYLTDKYPEELKELIYLVERNISSLEEHLLKKFPSINTKAKSKQEEPILSQSASLSTLSKTKIPDFLLFKEQSSSKVEQEQENTVSTTKFTSQTLIIPCLLEQRDYLICLMQGNFHLLLPLVSLAVISSFRDQHKKNLAQKPFTNLLLKFTSVKDLLEKILELPQVKSGLNRIYARTFTGKVMEMLLQNIHLLTI